MSHPWVTIVTPSYNQGRFLRRTIESVRRQDYPYIEHLVIDGGSRDETLDILRSYGPQNERWRWLSEPDEGQSAAINKGLRSGRGEIIAWLNSDDVYAAGAVAHGVTQLQEQPDAVLLYGHGLIIDEADQPRGPFVGIEPFQLWRLLHVLDFILQPATFFRRAAVEEIGYLDEGLHYAMDWDLWLRLAAVGEVIFTDRVLAHAREYAATKTSTGGWKRIRELGRLVRKHSGRFWTPGVQLYALDTLRQGMRTRLPPALRPAIDRPVAAISRCIQERLPVHADGWLGPDAPLVVPRRWGSAHFAFEAMALPPSDQFAVTLSADSSTLGSIEVTSPGSWEITFPLPQGNGPFATVRVKSGHTFRPDPASSDHRQLAIRCQALEPATKAPSDPGGCDC